MNEDQTAYDKALEALTRYGREASTEGVARVIEAETARLEAHAKYIRELAEAHVLQVDISQVPGEPKPPPTRWWETDALWAMTLLAVIVIIALTTVVGLVFT